MAKKFKKERIGTIYSKLKKNKTARIAGENFESSLFLLHMHLRKMSVEVKSLRF